MKTNKIKYIVFQIVLAILANSLYSQTYNCVLQSTDVWNPNQSGNCFPNMTGDWLKYRSLNTYIPDLDFAEPLHNPPIKTIQINFNIFQKNDGTGNFQNNQQTKDRLINIINYINSFYSGYGPSDPISWVTELPNFDSRIRFSLGDVGDERIYFYQDDQLWSGNSSPTNYLQNNFPDRLDQLNIYVQKESSNGMNWAYANFPNWINFDANSSVVMFCWENTGGDWAISKLLAHEFGHNLQLHHTYIGGGDHPECDKNSEEFLSDVFLITQPDVSNCPHYANYFADAFATNGDGITNNMLGGNQSQEYLSPMQAGQIHRALAISSVRKYVKSDKSNIPLNITSNEVWDFNIKLYRDIIIEDGSILTLSCNLEMLPDAQIIVEPGGQLIVDGGTITNACGDFWQGIVVIGQQNQPQTTQYQGAVRLTNGATIENAVYGVQLFDRQTDGEPAESTAGGLLIATDAIFKNNKTAITAGYYNYSGSYIQNCDFIIDGDYYESSSSQPFFVDLHSINAFYFRGNHFKNEVTDVSVSTSQLPIGIRSYNAGLQIKLGNIFENLQYGVKATENNFSNVSEISSNTFTKNLTGIYMSGVSAPQIFYNEFEAIPFNTALPIDQTFTGVYLDGVQGHSVEENTFYSNLSGIPDKQHPCIGLVVNNGGTQDVEVYLNTFEYLDFAILAQNNNRSSNGLNGLCIKCNEFNYNGSDVSVTAGPLIPASLAGIALNQGSGAADDNAPAGNLFSELNSNLQWQFNNINGVDHQVTYWYHSTNYDLRLKPDLNYINNVILQENIFANYINACQSKQVGGGGIGKTEAMAMMDNSRTEFESTESTLLSLTDEGNTPALQTEVNTSTPNESYELRNELLDVAPYTSEEVLIDATEKEDVLTDALIRDVLVANPQSAKSDEVLEAIENRSAAMPQYMKDQIAAGASLVSEKEELEAKSFYFKTAYTNALNDLVFIYMSDTTLSNPLDSVIAQLEAANYLYAKYQLANIYSTLNEFEALNALLSSIPENFILKDELLTEYEQLNDYFEIMIDLHNSNRNINQLTESEITDLTYWYENESNLAANWALNVLRESGNISYQEPYILPDDELKSSTIQIQSSGSTGTGNHELLQVYPNPANDYMVCEYQLDGVYSRASISMIQSGSAKAVFTRVLENLQDALVIDLAEYKAGNYLLMLIVDGKTIETKSINIIK